MLKAWIQRADFSSTEFEIASTKEAITLYCDHDWSAELNFMETVKQQSGNHCDPGIGFVLKSGNILHICPDKNSSLIFFHKRIDYRFLGILSRAKQETISCEMFPLNRVANCIELFISNDFHGLESVLSSATGHN